MTELQIICEEVDTLIESLGGYWSKEWLLQPVIEELGEFSKELQIDAGLHPGKLTSKEKLEEEFGDLLFAVIALGRGLEINIEKAILSTIAKYQTRSK
jgi:NTP pyrophosphatase (non-canonical NTP hydrolase)